MSQPDTDTRIDSILEAVENDYFNLWHITPYTKREPATTRAEAHQAIKALLASQVAAEYKQLLSELPSNALPPTSDQLLYNFNLGFQQGVDQCRAIIKAKIKEVEGVDSNTAL